MTIRTAREGRKGASFTYARYGSLLAAHSQALRGFGAMAILGEIFCLSAAVIVLPMALLGWRRPAALRCSEAVALRAQLGKMSTTQVFSSK